jgi:hypothetical protein
MDADAVVLQQRVAHTHYEDSQGSGLVSHRAASRSLEY